MKGIFNQQSECHQWGGGGLYYFIFFKVIVGGQ